MKKIGDQKTEQTMRKKSSRRLLPFVLIAFLHLAHSACRPSLCDSARRHWKAETGNT